MEAATAQRPLRLRGSGRLAPSPDDWTAPLPPSLLARVDEAKRVEHERLIAKFRDAGAKVVELRANLEQQRVDDETSLRDAIARAKRVPSPKAPAVQNDLEEAERALDGFGRMVMESASGLFADLDDDDLSAALAETRNAHDGIVDSMPGKVAELKAELDRAGALGSEVQWIGTLKQRRQQQPWRRPSYAPLSTFLSSAKQSLHRAETELRGELTERHHRENPPHHPPPSRGFAPPAGTWEGLTGRR
jgi:hypothetical protein